MMAKKTDLAISTRVVERQILFLRGERVLLDRDLAALYQVKPIALRQAVKRNKDRFPADFLFQLTEGEAKVLVSQSVIPSQQSLGGHLPYAFTEQGVAMLSSVLRSERAVRVNVEIMRAFVRLREILSANTDLARKLTRLEHKYDAQFKVVFDAIRQLMTPPPEPPRKKIGFKAD
jgi:hypothetical protein